MSNVQDITPFSRRSLWVSRPPSEAFFTSTRFTSSAPDPFIIPDIAPAIAFDRCASFPLRSTITSTKYVNETTPPGTPLILGNASSGTRTDVRTTVVNVLGSTISGAKLWSRSLRKACIAEREKVSDLAVRTDLSSEFGFNSDGLSTT